jgi:hypothetical protein
MEVLSSEMTTRGAMLDGGLNPPCNDDHAGRCAALGDRQEARNGGPDHVDLRGLLHEIFRV